MKRRGITPTARSYTSYFAALARGVAAHSLPASAFTRASTVHNQWLQHAASRIADADPASSDSPNPAPTNAYLHTLGRTGNVDEMIKVFDQMPQSGPLSPNVETYTTVLRGLKATAGGAEPDQLVAMSFKVWERMTKDSSVVAVADARLVHAALLVWQKAGLYVQRQRALAIARDWLGFTDNGAEFEGEPKVQLDAPAFNALLEFLLVKNDFKRVADYFDQVRDNPTRFGGEGSVIQPRHCELAMAAHARARDALRAEGALFTFSS
jgi:pentatricopeptide repeat protein